MSLPLTPVCGYLDIDTRIRAADQEGTVGDWTRDLPHTLTRTHALHAARTTVVARYCSLQGPAQGQGPQSAESDCVINS